MKFGPSAALCFSLLDDECKKLFEWSTQAMQEDPLFYSSMMQSVACRFPMRTYWEVLQVVREIATSPQFADVRKAAMEQSIEDCSKEPS